MTTLGSQTSVEEGLSLRIRLLFFPSWGYGCEVKARQACGPAAHATQLLQTITLMVCMEKKEKQQQERSAGEQEHTFCMKKVLYFVSI